MQEIGWPILIMLAFALLFYISIKVMNKFPEIFHDKTPS